MYCRTLRPVEQFRRACARDLWIHYPLHRAGTGRRQTLRRYRASPKVGGSRQAPHVAGPNSKPLTPLHTTWRRCSRGSCTCCRVRLAHMLPLQVHWVTSAGRPLNGVAVALGAGSSSTSLARRHTRRRAHPTRPAGAAVRGHSVAVCKPGALLRGVCLCSSGPRRGSATYRAPLKARSDRRLPRVTNWSCSVCTVNCRI